MNTSIDGIAEDWSLDRVNQTTADFRARFGYDDTRLDVPQYRKFLGDWGLLDLVGMKTETVDDGPCRGVWVWREGTTSTHRMLYLHGGGYVGGGWLSHGSLAEGFAREMDAAVFFCDYRLSPECPYPGPLNDAMEAYQYISQRGPEKDKRPAETVFVAGDSAGGGMAIALAMRCRDEGLTPPAGLVAMGAFFDLDPTTSDMIQASGCVAGMAEAYASKTDRRHPHVSPLYGDLRGLPPILLQTGTKDYLLQDTIRMSAALTAAEADHQLDLWEDMPHVWQKFRKFFEPARRAQALAAGYLDQCTRKDAQSVANLRSGG